MCTIISGEMRSKWNLKERALQAAELEVSSHTKRVQVLFFSPVFLSCKIFSHQEDPGLYSMRNKILPARLSFAIRCWKRIWKALRTGFCWPARWWCCCCRWRWWWRWWWLWCFCWWWSCSCWWTRMFSDFDHLSDENYAWHEWFTFAQKLDKAATAVDDSDRMRKVLEHKSLM